MVSPLPIHVDPRSATPLYDQIASQIRHAVAAGTLRPGDALPSVRQLAVALRINPNTVARAYRDLETEGALQTRHGLGTFVAASADKRLSPAARRKALAPTVSRLAAEAHVLGVEPEELADIVLETARRLASGRSGPAPGERT